jgi:AhpD family alkylhydroperoxidase
MNARIDYQKLGTKRVQPLLALQAQVDGSGLGARLLGLVEMRASQINGCAYCLDMHSKDARAAGESEQRLYGLDAWREAPYYDARELADLTLAVVAINAWNRIAISFRLPAGSHKARAGAAAAGA